MFRFKQSLDVVTIFHQPKLNASVRALKLLKHISAQASEPANEEQAVDRSSPNKARHSEFELNVTEDPPTSDQLRTILEYIGAARAKDVVDGSSNISDAIMKLQEDRKRFRAPVIVDWNNGKAVVGDNESEILKLVEQLPKGANS